MSRELSIEVNLTPTQIIEAVLRMKKEERTSFVEDLLAAASPEYIKSIEEAREDYKKGRIYSHKEVFKTK
ncbi:MAG: hypothetical protein WC879_03740 [Melioribacteraceae bacterium]